MAFTIQELAEKEIVKLWKESDVSLVHRSYFFLLLEGDLTDSTTWR